MNYNELKKGDVLSNSYIYIKTEKDISSFFVLNGFYIVNIKDNKVFSYETDYNDDELQKILKINKDAYFLNGKDLNYGISKKNNEDFEKDLKIICNINDDNELSIDYINQFKNHLYRLNSDRMKYKHEILRQTIMFSKCFNDFDETNLEEGFKFKKGDIFIDNLQGLNRYEEYKNFNDTDLKNNYWMAIRKTEIGFIAINLSNTMVFHFSRNGTATHLGNDIDNRFSNNGNNTLRGNIIDEIEIVSTSFEKNFNRLDKDDSNLFFYKYEKLEENSYFHGLKLTDKVKLKDEEIKTILNDTYFSLIEYQYQYNIKINEINRNLFSNIEREYYKSLDPDDYFFKVSYSLFDNNDKLQEKYFGTEYYYERYIWEHFKEKFYYIEKIIENYHKTDKYDLDIITDSIKEKLYNNDIENLKFFTLLFEERFKILKYSSIKEIEDYSNIVIEYINNKYKNDYIEKDKENYINEIKKIKEEFIKNKKISA